jgi:hypothetical protein
MPKGTCSVDECGGPVVARGWCAKHYCRWKSSGDPLIVRKRQPGPVKACSEGDCGKPVFGHGWCQMHYARWRKHGDPLVTGRIIGDTEARFWEKVNKDGPAPEHRPDLGPCWVWTASLNAGTHQGYGHFGVGQKVVFAHRFSYELANGPIPDDRPHIDHLCRNHACVRPSHLDPVTNRQNSLRGNRTKLPDELVASLHARWQAGERSVDLAAEAGTHRTNLLKRFKRITLEAAAVPLAVPQPPEGMLF